MYGCIKTIKIESLSCSNIQISKMSVHFSDASDVLFCLEWKSVALMSDFWRQKCLKWFNYKTSLLPAKDDAIELHSWKCRRVIKKISCNQILVSADCEKKRQPLLWYVYQKKLILWYLFFMVQLLQDCYQNIEIIFVNELPKGYAKVSISMFMT